MGQYRQWLHYRDIDRHLHLQREQLTHEIAHLQEQLHCLEAAHPDVNNSIVQALITQQTIQSVQPRAITPPTSISSLSPDVPLPEWVREETRQYTPNPQTPLPTVPPTSHTYASLPPLPHPMHPQYPQYPQSQNDDISAPTDPQITIPHWLRRAASVSQSGPLDPQGVQTNRLVQRWLERWGKQLPEQPYQDQAPSDRTSFGPAQQTNSIDSFTHKDSYQ